MHYGVIAEAMVSTHGRPLQIKARAVSAYETAVSKAESKTGHRRETGLYENLKVWHKLPEGEVSEYGSSYEDSFVDASANDFVAAVSEVYSLPSLGSEEAWGMIDGPANSKRVDVTIWEILDKLGLAYGECATSYIDDDGTGVVLLRRLPSVFKPLNPAHPPRRKPAR